MPPPPPPPPSTATAEEANISVAMEARLLADIDDVVDGNVDYKGSPAKRSKSGCWTSASFIIGVEMAERFVYYGISVNLISYLTGPLGMSTATAAANVNAWSGTAQLLPLLGAFVADSFLGRYRTIIISSLLYILGLGLLTLSTAFTSSKVSGCHNGAKVTTCSPSEFQVIFFLCALYVIAVAQGGHKPCVQAFGADQFDGQDPQESKAKSSFFNWLFFATCGAITVALVILTYIQDNLSWSLGFGIPCIVMAFALILFLFGTVTYRFRVSNSEASPFVSIGHVLLRAARNWRITSSVKSMAEESGSSLHCKGRQQFKRRSFLDKALLVPDSSKEDIKLCSISEVEEAKTILRLFPIWATCLAYGIVYSQSSTLFTKQGVTMDRFINSSFEIPAASLESVISVSIVVFVAIYDLVLVPVARAITTRPSGITLLQRIGTGIFLSVLSMVVAALVEIKRLETAKKNGLVDKPKAMIPMSVFWLTPQYLILGVSEAFTIVGIQEFFYDQVPGQLKSTGIALNLSIFGIGSFLSSFLINVIDKATSTHGHDSWFADNLNKAHLDYFYWVLAGFSAIALTFFMFFAKSYVYNQARNT